MKVVKYRVSQVGLGQVGDLIDDVSGCVDVRYGFVLDVFSSWI